MANNKFQITENDLAIQLPTRMVIVGSSLCGKSVMILRLLKARKQMFNKDFSQIHYIYPDSMQDSQNVYLQKIKDAVPNINIWEGLHNFDFDSCKHEKSHKLIIIDDCMHELNDAVGNIFIRDGHHFSCSIILTAQNYFFQGLQSLDIRRNASDLIFFNDRSDVSILQTISRKKFAKNLSLMPDAMEWVRDHIEKKIDQYLYLECNPKCKISPELSLRTNILPNKEGLIEPIIFTTAKNN